MNIAICNRESEQTEFPLLLTVGDMAAILKVSVRTVWRLRSAHKLPESIEFGGSVRWKGEEVRKWIGDGCPLLSTGDNATRR